MKETTVTDFRCSQEKPTIVFCHGAWHTPAHFEPVQQLFESNGYPTRCPRQPSCGAVPPNVSMYEDARALRLVLEDLVEGQRKYVVLVLHSYGGIVGTQATDHSLAKQTREHLGLPGGVLGLLYMCAFVLPLGQSLQGLLGAPPPHVTIRVCLATCGEASLSFAVRAWQSVAPVTTSCLRGCRMTEGCGWTNQGSFVTTTFLHRNRRTGSQRCEFTHMLPRRHQLLIWLTSIILSRTCSARRTRLSLWKCRRKW